MSHINEEKIISHKVKTIKQKVEELDIYASIKENPKTQKSKEKILKELEKLFSSYMESENDNFFIKKKITISSKKRSKSFKSWLFNNREL